ncbi:MAG: hypothetical protein IJK40_10565 [Clostridia bacterium]|nr:hypothetical protein [Clostridia bacterium]
MTGLWKKGIALLAAGMILVGLSSCNVFSAMRENAEKAAKIEIQDSPTDIAAAFNAALEEAKKQADELKESVRYKTGRPEILNADGEKAGILNTTADQLAKLIMSSAPGASSSEPDPTDPAGTLLQPLKNEDISLVNVRRNEANERVTDEKGREQSDDEGNAVTRVRVKDNLMTLTLEFVGSAEEDENYKSVPRLDDAVIESIFGKKADKAAVLAAFDVIGDYAEVRDYETAYRVCKIVCEINLDSGVPDYIHFEKNMTVTAKVTGKGRLEEYGELTVRLPLTETINYDYTYFAE